MANSPYYNSYTGKPTATPPQATVKPPVNATLSKGIVDPGKHNSPYTAAYTAKKGTGRP